MQLNKLLQFPHSTKEEICTLKEAELIIDLDKRTLIGNSLIHFPNFVSSPTSFSAPKIYKISNEKYTFSAFGLSSKSKFIRS